MTLPPALAPLEAFPRFIAAQTRPDPEHEGKTIKEPLDWRSGRLCNPLDPTNQTTYANVATSGYLPAFVFDARDKLGFIDIDNCRDGDDWTSFALRICGMFPGAASEVSQSGNGLHIIFRYTGPEPTHSKKNVRHGLEFYTDKRFMLLGGHPGSIGNAVTDCTAAMHALIAEYFPPNVYSDCAGWTDGPGEGYAGPTDDNTLLQMMLASGRPV